MCSQEDKWCFKWGQGVVGIVVSRALNPLVKQPGEGEGFEPVNEASDSSRSHAAFVCLK